VSKLIIYLVACSMCILHAILSLLITFNQGGIYRPSLYASVVGWAMLVHVYFHFQKGGAK